MPIFLKNCIVGPLLIEVQISTVLFSTAALLNLSRNFSQLLLLLLLLLNYNIFKILNNSNILSLIFNKFSFIIISE